MNDKVTNIILKTKYDNKGVKEAEKEFNKQRKQQKEQKKELEENVKKAKGVGSIINTAVLGKILNKTTEIIGKTSKASADYAETLNLLEVAFEGNTSSIKKFASSTAEILNLDDATILTAASKFRALASSMNLTSDSANNFAQILSQLTLDLSSLYNIDFNRMQLALQNAVSGYGQSLKKITGASVNESTIQTTLEALGVDLYIKDMNDAEKAVARLIGITYQMDYAQGDLARTIEQPANRLRSLSEQTQLAARSLGNIFLPVINAIIPYVTAAVIVINKLLSALASLVSLFFKFDISAIASGSLEDTINAYDDLGASVGGVGDAAESTAKKMQGLRGFDKLNVIKTPTSGGGSGGGGGGVGVNPALLEKLNQLLGQYDSKLDGIKTKATQIAEKFLEWLHILDPLKKPLQDLAGITFDALVYVWDNVLKPLGEWAGQTLLPTLIQTVAKGLDLVYQSAKNVSPILKTIFEGVVKPFASMTGKIIVQLLENIGNSFESISKSKILTTMLGLYSSAKLLCPILKIIGDTVGKTLVGSVLKDLITSLKNVGKNGTTIKSVFSDFFDIIGPDFKKLSDASSKAGKGIIALNNSFKFLKGTLAGAAIVVTGITMIQTAFKDIGKNGPTVTNVLTAVAGVIGIVSGALVVANTVCKALNVTMWANPILAVVGISALILSVAAAISGLSKSNEDAEVVTRNYTNATREQMKALEEAREQANQKLETDMASINRAEDLKNKLLELVDANGQVNETNRTQVEEILPVLNDLLGTQYTLQDGIIYNNGEEVKTIDEIANSVDNLIASKRIEIALEAYQATYVEALKAQEAAARDLEKAQQDYNTTVNDVTEAVKNNSLTETEARKIIEGAQRKLNGSVEEYSEAYNNAQKDIDKYEDLIKAKATGNADEMKKAYENSVGAKVKTTQEAQKGIDKLVEDSNKKINDSFGTLEKNAKTTCDSVNKTVKGAVPSKLTTVVAANTSKFTKSVNEALGNYTGGQLKIGVSATSGSGTSVFTDSNGYVHVYAQGGLPDVGQLFIANEKGPELVGQIGGQSFVANQNQIMDLLKRESNGNGVQSLTIPVQIGTKEIGKIVLDDLNEMAKSNGKPITIGG